MPYIRQERRRVLNVREVDPDCAGELNYYLTLGVKRYLRNKGKGYQTYNDILGVLTAMQLEIYRRLVASYEDEKCRTNGDVFF